ncbi:MAG: hypothetical protein E7Z89_05375 [Cyanobacteria bacterium SIG28]|nr:hypothetical protein [Cyanobacteria bacterium SIG28]
MDTGRTKIGSKDYLDKLLVEKYQDMYSVNPELYNIKYSHNDYEEKHNCDCGCNYCRNYEYNEEENMENEDKNNNEEQEQEEWNHPNKCYERLGVDILSVWIGQDLLPIFETYWNNMMCPKIKELRERITDQYGYIIPEIRFLDSIKLEPNAYQIYIRHKLVHTGYLDMNIDNSIEDIVKYSSCADKLLEDVEMICFEYVHQVVTKTDILKLLELVRSQDPTLVNDLIPMFISTIDLKKIYANLIHDKVSAIDIIYVFELLNDYARYTQDINELTEKLKQGLNFVH